MRFLCPIQSYLSFPKAILVLRADYLRVTHPFATGVLLLPFDLHVLGTPPAFILSQDQTLHIIFFLKLSLAFNPFCSSLSRIVCVNSFAWLVISLFSFQRPICCFSTTFYIILKSTFFVNINIKISGGQGWFRTNEP